MKHSAILAENKLKLFITQTFINPNTKIYIQMKQSFRSLHMIILSVNEIEIAKSAKVK